MRVTHGRCWKTLAGWTLLAAAGCASGGGGGGREAPSTPSYVQLSDAPEVVGSATVPNEGSPRPATAAASLLEAFSWPITSVDTAQGALDSDWQYFEPTVRASAMRGFCQSPMALRLTIRAISPGLTRLSAEAYLPGRTSSTGWSNALVPDEESGRREALAQARAVLASLRRAVVATTGDANVALGAWNDFGRQLDEGSYRRCSEQQR